MSPSPYIWFLVVDTWEVAFGMLVGVRADGRVLGTMVGTLAAVGKGDVYIGLAWQLRTNNGNATNRSPDFLSIIVHHYIYATVYSYRHHHPKNLVENASLHHASICHQHFRYSLLPRPQQHRIAGTMHHPQPRIPEQLSNHCRMIHPAISLRPCQWFRPNVEIPVPLRSQPLGRRRQ